MQEPSNEISESERSEDGTELKESKVPFKKWFITGTSLDDDYLRRLEREP